jgi:hypothetical protein
MLRILRNVLFYFILVVVFQVASNNYFNRDTVWFTDYILYGGTALVFLTLLFKIKVKWNSIRTLNKKAAQFEFTFNRPLNSAFLYWTKYNHITESAASLLFGAFIFIFDQNAWILCLLLLLNAIENLWFLYSNLRRQRFRIAVNQYAVAHNSKGIYILPFDQLKAIERKYDEFFFVYTNGETRTLPLNALQPQDLEEFRQLLDTKAREKEIFFSVRL